MTQSVLILLLLLALIALVFVLNWRRVTVVYPPNVGLLYRSGRFERELGPGRYTFFDPSGRMRVVQVSRASVPQVLGEITALSRDQFAFRVGIAPVVEVVDARAFAESQPGAIEPDHVARYATVLSFHPSLSAAASSAAVEAISKLTLREVVAEPRMLAEAIQSRLAEAIPGAAVPQVLVTSITLPPETRKMFTEVERSKLEAEASLERARGEQASLRALANAARLVKDNPALANLRFLQTLEQAPGAKTIVIGGNAVPLSLAGNDQG